jgi:8-oxo-dGTP pyrophosphatase MutT (NUDIX family)
MNQHSSSQNYYDTSAIRGLLATAFTDEDFTFFCYDYFRPVHTKFAVGNSLQSKIQLLIEYCQKNDLFDKLLSQVKEINPKQFENFGFHLYKKVSFFITHDELQEQIPIVEFISNSDDLFVGGVALRRFVRGHIKQLTKRIEKGTRLRILLLAPDSPDIVSIAPSFNKSPKDISSDILAAFGDIKDKLKPIGPDLVQVRMTIREPAFSFAISNPKKDGVLTAGLRAYSCDVETRPHFFLRRLDDEKWFDALVESCETLWEASHKPVFQKSGVVAYRSTEDGRVEILLITSREEPDNWIFPVGSVDFGESFQKAAARECVEESGYVVDIDQKLRQFEFDKGMFINRMTFFTAKVTGERTHYEEDRQRKWVQQSELIQNIAEDFLPIARAALVELAK